MKTLALCLSLTIPLAVAHAKPNVSPAKAEKPGPREIVSAIPPEVAVNAGLTKLTAREMEALRRARQDSRPLP